MNYAIGTMISFVMFVVFNTNQVEACPEEYHDYRICLPAEITAGVSVSLGLLTIYLGYKATAEGFKGNSNGKKD